MKLLLEVIGVNNSKTSLNQQIPIWLMRQAGRYLPEYREVRSKAGSFLNLCYNPDLASTVTLQPITRFGFDAAIIFSDILVLPQAMGLQLEFKEGEGPVLENILSLTELNKIAVKDVTDIWEFQKVYEALALTKANLPVDKTLIGFAGSPWTVATYILGGKNQDADYTRKIAYEQPELVNKIIDLVSEQTILHLGGQIEAGADIVQLFDSWSGLLTPVLFDEYVIKPTKKIIDSLKQKYPNTPIIAFPRGAGMQYQKFLTALNPDVIGLDYMVPLEQAKILQQQKPVQGNLDPLILLLTKDKIKIALDQILENLAGQNRFIFNLGHGILPSTPIENVEFLVDYVRNFKR